MENLPQVETKPGMKHFWKVFIAVFVSIIVAGGGVWYYESTVAKAQKDDLNSQIALLQSQVKDLQTKTTASTAAKTVPATNSQSSSTTTPTDYLATLKTFCDDQSESGSEVKRYYYLENTDGKFGDCVIGQISGGAGGNLFTKLIDNQWTKIWSGNGFISQATVDQYKIPIEIAPKNMIQ